MSPDPTFNPNPPPSGTPPPKVLGNHEPDDRRVYVTYSLPGLRRATVHVPRERWKAGGHAQVGQAVARMMAELDLQAQRRSDSVPE